MREPQYARVEQVERERGLVPLGVMVNQAWEDDPKHLLFTLSRYKFVSRVLGGRKRILEVGCGDGWATRLVVDPGREVVAVDFDLDLVQRVQRMVQTFPARWKFACCLHDITISPPTGVFDGVYALDVIEHIGPLEAERAVGHMAEVLGQGGMLILGTPNRDAEQWSSPISKAGHVNLLDAVGLRDLLMPLFRSIQIFSMNDEVVHTGFYPMAHYLLAVATDKVE